MLIIQYAMQIVAQVGALIAWFAIVVLGRQPKGLQDMIVLGMSYQQRATAYFALLTEDWPPFTDDADSHTVEAAPAFGALAATPPAAGPESPTSVPPGGYASPEREAAFPSAEAPLPAAGARARAADRVEPNPPPLAPPAAARARAEPEPEPPAAAPPRDDRRRPARRRGHSAGPEPTARAYAPPEPSPPSPGDWPDPPPPSPARRTTRMSRRPARSGRARPTPRALGRCDRVALARPLAGLAGREREALDQLVAQVSGWMTASTTSSDARCRRSMSSSYSATPAQRTERGALVGIVDGLQLVVEHRVDRRLRAHDRDRARWAARGTRRGRRRARPSRTDRRRTPCARSRENFGHRSPR